MVRTPPPPRVVWYFTNELPNRNTLTYELTNIRYAEIWGVCKILQYFDKQLSMSSESLTSATNKEALVIVDYISKFGKLIWDLLADAFVIVRHEQYDVQSKLLIVLSFWLLLNILLIVLAWSHYGQRICENIYCSSGKSMY